MPNTTTSWNVRNFARTHPVFEEKPHFLIGSMQALGSAVIGVLIDDTLTPRVLAAAGIFLGALTAKAEDFAAVLQPPALSVEAAEGAVPVPRRFI